MRHIVLAGIAAAALALGGCSWFSSDESQARNTASPWDSDATRDRQAADLRLNSPTEPSMQVAAGSTASGATTGSTAGGGAPMSRAQIRQAQQTLKTAGLYQGPIDGITGPQTKQAITAFQQGHSLPATGVLDQQTAALLEQSPMTGTGSTTPPSGAGMGRLPQTQSGTMGVSPSGEPNTASGGKSGAGGGTPGGQH